METDWEDGYWHGTTQLRFVRHGDLRVLQQKIVRTVKEWKTYGGKECLTKRVETAWQDVPEVEEHESRVSEGDSRG